MAIITRSEVHYHGGLLLESEGMINALGRFQKSLGQAVGIFLSHSHHDRDLLRGLLKILRDNGADGYIDWQDAEMPQSTGRETAERVKAKIKENEKFAVVLTGNSRSSMWVPWELGVADSEKGLTHVALWPVADDDGAFYGREYLLLYSRIEKAADGRYAVFAPGQTQGIFLSEWIKLPLAG